MLESERRLEAAISGAKPDRAPTAPCIYFFAARHAGIPLARLVHEPTSYRAAMERCWEDFGPWDAYFPLNAVSRGFMSLAMPMKAVYPGVELGEDDLVQFLEEEIMRVEDYDLLAEPFFPHAARRIREGLRREIRAWADGAMRRGLSPQRIVNAPRALGGRIARLMETAYGGRRDIRFELQGWSDLVGSLARLARDPEIDPGLTLRHLGFILRMSGRILGRKSFVANLVGAFLAGYEQIDFTRYDYAAWRARGVAPLFGMGLEGPFDSFSMARSLIPFSTEDLFQRRETVARVSAGAVDLTVALAELGTALTGVPRFILACHRTSNDFISPEVFRDVAFPPMREIVEKLAARGISVVLHCDGKWDLNLPTLARLPEGRCVFQLDGRTDIFLARRVLGEGHCLFGDVPAAMLAFGSVREVQAYRRRLLREVGAQGRFILAAGCEIPPNAKPENVRALLRPN